MYIENVGQADKMLSGLIPVERFVWAFEVFPLHAIIVSISGSSAETVHTASLAHAQLGLTEPFQVLFVDNRLNETYSPTTLPYVHWLKERGSRHGYRLHIAQGELGETELRAKYPLWDKPGSEDSQAAKEANKQRPFEQALLGAALWINGARRAEQKSREHIPFLKRRMDGLLVLAALADVIGPDTLRSNPDHFDPFKQENNECGLLPYQFDI